MKHQIELNDYIGEAFWSKKYKIRTSIIVWSVVLLFLSLFYPIDSYIGFALDDEGLLYVGKLGEINVYDNGELIRTPYRTSSGGYRFTIRNERLYVQQSGVITVFDLTGTRLEKIDAPEVVQRFNEDLNSQVNVLVRCQFWSGGARYEATNIFGYYRITRVSRSGNEVVYQNEPFTAVVVIMRVLLVGVSIILFVTTFTKITADYNKKERTNNHRRYSND
jgi:hypothetical protein